MRLFRFFMYRGMMIDETESNVNLESNKFYEQNRFKNFDFTSYM